MRAIPRPFPPHFLLAALYDSYDMFEEALAEYAIVLEKDPGHVKAAFNMGTLCGQLGDLEGAVTLFERVLELKPDLKEAMNSLGSIYESMGLPEQAAEQYRKSLGVDPLQEEPHIRLALIYFLKSRCNPFQSHREDAIRRLQFVLGINPQNKKAKELLKEILGPDDYTGGERRGKGEQIGRGPTGHG